MPAVTHECPACTEKKLTEVQHRILEKMSDGCLLERRLMPGPVAFRMRTAGGKDIDMVVSIESLRGLAAAGLLADPMRHEEPRMTRRPRGGVWAPVRLTQSGFECVLCRAHTT